MKVIIYFVWSRPVSLKAVEMIIYCTVKANNVSHGDTGYHREAGQQAIVATKATTQSILNQIGLKKMISIQNG